MRIIAGKYRRRTLLTNPGETTRPITDRVKVILFDRIEGYLPDAHVADIFAGTGTMGLEALSRGASTVVFYEQDRRAHELLQQNVAKLHVEEETVCWRVDVLRTSFRPKGVENFLPYNVIFFDPPYRMTPSIKPGSPLFKSLVRLANPEISAEDALLILRCERRAEFSLPEAWRLDQSIIENRMALHFFRRGAETPRIEAEGEPAAETIG